VVRVVVPLPWYIYEGGLSCESRKMYMYIWLRMESGEMGEGGSKGERWMIRVRGFHGEYEEWLGFSWLLDLLSKR
jgi:hypothetical protein